MAPDMKAYSPNTNVVTNVIDVIIKMLACMIKLGGEVKYKVKRGHPEMMLISLLMKKNNI